MAWTDTGRGVERTGREKVCEGDHKRETDIVRERQRDGETGTQTDNRVRERSEKERLTPRRDYGLNAVHHNCD